mmetsp:Transcript_1746/g.3360  ORF Transcript_1746/g.3360 Transcript_1746/m.3360 type:complete len:543 (+) Transcript_1746:151-1779(+)
MKFVQAIRHVHVVCLLVLAGRQVEAGMSTKKSKMSKSEKSGKSMNYMYSKKGMGKSSKDPEPGATHAGANVFEKMSEKSSMSMSYKGDGTYIYPTMSSMSTKGTKGADSYSMKSEKSGSKKSTMSESMSGKGKGGSMSIRMMSGKGKGKGKGKGGAIYDTQAPTTPMVNETASPTEPLIITRSPTVPSQAPVTSPPTRSPTAPPFVEANELCEPNEDGVYGTTEGTVEIVDFAYALETLPGTTDAEVEQIIDDLEGEIAASVIRRLAPECDDEAARRLAQQENQDETTNLLSLVEPSPVSQRRLAQVLVGLSPKPDDERLTDRECDKDVGENRCDLVSAKLTIYYIDDGTRRLVQESITEVLSRRAQASIVDQVEGAIQLGMNNGEFDDNEGRTSESVVSVEWVSLDDISDRDVGPGDNSDDGLDLLWIIIICAGGFAVILLILAVFLCTRRASSVDNDVARRDIKADQVSNALSAGGGPPSNVYGGAPPSTGYGGSSPYGAPNANYAQNEESSVEEEEEESERQLGRFRQSTGSDSGKRSV